jgi:integrase
MPRQAKLRKKKVGKSVYWFTKAGGDTYFGSVTDVPYKEARRLFSDHVKNLAGEDGTSKGRHGLTAGELMDLFLDWIKKNRCEQTYTTRKNYCSRFGAFSVKNSRIEDLPANRVRSADLEAFLEQLTEEGLGAQTRLHAETSVRHCWNWATKHPSPTPYLPPTYRPFSATERTHVPLKPLTEADLLTQAEIDAAFFCADIDLNQFRRHGLKKTVARKGTENLKRSGNFSEMLKCYYHTGARTDELASCEPGDILHGTRQIILGRHKRSRTQRTPTVRYITLNNEAFGILSRHAAGKGSSEKVFVRDNGCRWTVRTLAKRFERVKEIAAALGRPIRDEITIYDFRHLWISECLMAGNDIATVARMAGTSIAMIERVYGHFRNDHLQEAQARLDESRKQRR